ncbi:C-type lectin 37Da-like [Bradysia coprophila]|uniref:C-type lectin 37Da-like n=1 Tax=Bradysia coprophila TaxID=38358 RepID=UPI00187D9EFB|nr:C-type lectin 37Da-like [Bradysia coprophila]
MSFQIILVYVLLSYTSAQELNKEFKVETYFKANWFEASIFCRDHGMQLATVNTDAEHLAVIQQFPKVNEDLQEYENYWISGTDLAEDGNYKWFSTGKMMLFTKWDYMQPPELIRDPYQTEPIVDNAEDCVQILGYSKRWASTNCSSLYYFVCETF